MVQANVTIKNKSGLHARPASDFVKTARDFGCSIEIGRPADDVLVNAKSIVRVLSLGICKDDTIRIMAQGNDEDEALTALLELAQNGFGEI